MSEPLDNLGIWEPNLGFGSQNSRQHFAEFAVPLGAFPVTIPEGLPGWLVAFVTEALRENQALDVNGAHPAAAAGVALLNRLIAAAQAQDIARRRGLR